MEIHMLKLAILISGRGSNMEAIIKSCQAGRIDGKVALVISNKESAKGLEVARSLGVETKVCKTETDIIVTLKGLRPDLVCLAGYMKIISSEFVNAFPHKIINVHPALLPSFPGLHGQRQAVEYGVKVSGCTVHFVDEGCDTGPIIAQAVVPVSHEDTEEALSARIIKEEHRLYSEAIQLIAQGKVTVKGRVVHVRT